MNRSIFMRRCRKHPLFEGETGFFDETGRPDEEFYDDGWVHIVRFGKRGCFYIGEVSDRKVEQMMRKIKKEIGL